MNVKNPNLVIIRSIHPTKFPDHFSLMWIDFDCDYFSQTIPVDVNYVGFYSESHDSMITHIGIVNEIEPYDNGKDYFLKAIVKLENPLEIDHPIKGYEYRELSNFNLTELELSILNNVTIPNEHIHIFLNAPPYLLKLN